MDADQVNGWLGDYVAAWKSYDPNEIAALFSENVEYRYHPYDEPIRGRDAVVESWVSGGGLAEGSTRDEEGTYDATYETVAVDGDVAVAVGTSSYSAEPGGPTEHLFHNCFVMRFDAEGRCREFTEYFIERPNP